MLPRDAIVAAIRAASAGGRPALVGFLTAGFPRKEDFAAQLAAVGEAADVVEPRSSQPWARRPTWSRSAFPSPTRWQTA